VLPIAAGGADHTWEGIPYSALIHQRARSRLNHRCSDHREW
jgi:hypothetical protein